jgi:hypothetical protein
MKKVLSFSLWGNNPTYNTGAIKNAELAKIYYPDFECWFYIHIDSVPQTTIESLKQLNNTKIILKSGYLNLSKPMCWRFEAIDDPEVEVMMSRDTDTRILMREKLAVDEWLSSGKLFHIMRDHPHHNFLILGGMFGSKKIPQIPSWINIINNFIQIGNRDYDQDFLRNYIYPHINNNCLVHTSFQIYPNENSRRFPITYDNSYKFVGEYVYADESRSIYHIEELKKQLKNN